MECLKLACDCFFQHVLRGLSRSPRFANRSCKRGPFGPKRGPYVRIRRACSARQILRTCAAQRPCRPKEQGAVRRNSRTIQEASRPRDTAPVLPPQKKIRGNEQQRGFQTNKMYCNDKGRIKSELKAHTRVLFAARTPRTPQVRCSSLCSGAHCNT